MSRRKGAAGELEVVKLLHAHGFLGVRTRSGGGQARLDIAGVPGFAIECKRQERQNVTGWWLAANAEVDRDVPVVAHRKNGSPWLATIALGDLLDLIEAAQG